MFNVGIIGGMGPAATVELFKRIILYTLADSDQEHLKILILNDSTIPDRSDYLLKSGESPLPKMVENIEIAKSIGCKYFAIPCNTSHFFYEKFNSIRGIQFINMVEETCNYVYEKYPNKDICVLATLGTIKCDIYNKISGRKRRILYPPEDINYKIMKIIRKIKAGHSDFEGMANDLEEILSRKFSNNNMVYILACTELSILLPFLKGEYIDALDILAGKIIIKCNKVLNEDEYPLDAELLRNRV